MADFLVSFPGLGIHDMEINRVAFSLFGLDIYWYGLIIAGGILLCLIMAYMQASKFKISQDFLLDNFIVVIIASLIGARAYYVVFSLDEFSDNWWKVFDIRQGGMAFYGGVLAALLAIIIMHLIKKKSIPKMLDFIVVYLPLGQAIGRWGNFVNQEAFGVNTDLPWGMISNGTRDYLAAYPELGQNPNLPVHPTFLYESLGNLLIFVALIIFRRYNKWKCGVVALYLIGYGVLRGIVEGLRTDALFIGNTNIRVSQLISLIMVIVGIIYFIVALILEKKNSNLLLDKRYEQAQLDMDAKISEMNEMEAGDHVLVEKTSVKAKKPSEGDGTEKQDLSDTGPVSILSAEKKSEEDSESLNEEAVETTEDSEKDSED